MGKRDLIDWSLFGGALEVQIAKMPTCDPGPDVMEDEDGNILAPHGRPWWWLFGPGGTDPWNAGYAESLPRAVFCLARSVVVDGWPNKLYYPLGSLIRWGLPPMERFTIRGFNRLAKLGRWFDGWGRY